MTYVLAVLLVANLAAHARTRHTTRTAADRATSAATTAEAHAMTCGRLAGIRAFESQGKSANR